MGDCMDPITVIVTALAAGAAAGLKPTAEQTIKDGYSAIKVLIQHKYGNLSIEALEQKPGSETKRASLAEDLSDAGAADDDELLDHAKSLLDTIKTRDPATAAKLNINLEEVEAAYFKLKDAIAEGSLNVGIKKGSFNGGIDMEELTAGMPPLKK